MIQTQERSDRRIDAAIGVIGGLAGGLLGVGGGFVMVPLQVIWASRTQHRATGTSLAAILPIAVVAGATYYFGGRSPQT
ncbi:MAG TPA: TSUP family transporter, partial [Candidatus Acidoferrum sp.]|nr:TSUP family transporter [Candidatus Acidoferrum sp.]